MCFLGLSLEKVHTGSWHTCNVGEKGGEANQNNKPVTLYAN